MRGASIIAGLLLALAVCASVAGDVVVVFLRHYEVPDRENLSWEQLTSDEVAEQVEVVLSGAEGRRVLTEAGCEKLSQIYYTITGDDDIARALREIASLSEDNLFIYMIDDREGLTETQMDFGGLCEYDDPEAGNWRHAFLCGHCRPERAIKIGEHFARVLEQRFLELEGVSGADSYNRIAINGLILGEAMRTVVEADWQPNNMIIQPRREGSGDGGEQGGNYANGYTLMPAQAGANLRALELYAAACTVFAFQDLFDEFYFNRGILLAARGSEVREALPEAADAADAVAEHDGFIWQSIPLPELFGNEVFGALVLYYMSYTQPPVADEDGANRHSFYQVLESCYADGAARPWAEVVQHLMDLYEGGHSAEELRMRRLFYLSLVDTLLHFRGNREALEGALMSAGMFLAEEIDAVLDAYLGAGNEADLRGAIRASVSGEDTLRGRVDQLRERFDQGWYRYFSASTRRQQQRISR